MIIIGNGFGATIGYFALRSVDVPLPLWPLPVCMWVLLLPMFRSWLRLRRRPQPERVSVRRIRLVTIYSGVLGLTWAAMEIYYLTSAPFAVSAFLMAGCAFLAVGAITAAFVIPAACVLYAVPMMGAAIYISAISDDPSGPAFVGLLLLMGTGMLWFLRVNWMNFATVLDLYSQMSSVIGQQNALIRENSRITHDLQVSNRSLQTLAATDGLTGLVNRREFEQALRRKWETSRASGTFVSVMIIDADNFKTINDRFGHLVGDLCIRLIATSLREALGGEGAILSRFGGDEFVAVVEAVSTAGLLEIAEIIRTRIEDAGHPYGLTVSVGVFSGEKRPAVLDATEKVRRADAALYQAKLQGKNSVVLFAS